jgi:RNA polymerase sigma-70 factor (sigma-E family)
LTFEEFVHSRGPALVRFARLITGDDHRADDLVQDVLAKAYVKWRRVSAADNPEHYVRRMIVNANTSWWRRRSSTEVSVAAPGEPAQAGRAFDSDLAERDHQWELVARLPLRQRAVLVLRYYEDLDDASIADILGVSPVTVRTTALRALTALRQQYTFQESTTSPRSPR